MSVLVEAPVDSPLSSYPTWFTGASVAAAAINANGGINGRPLKVITCDMKNTPAIGAQCVQNAIAQGAVARASSISILGAVEQPLLRQANMADFASIPVLDVDVNGFNNFPLAPGAQAFYGYADLMKQRYPTAKTAVILGTDSSAWPQIRDRLAQGASKEGLQVLDKITIPARTADVSPILGQIKALNPDVILTQIVAADEIKMWSAAKALGWLKPYISSSSGHTPEILAQTPPDLAKYVNYVDYVPSFGGTAPGAADFRAQMAKYAKGQALSRDAWVSWIGIQAFAAVVKSIKGPITRESVVGTLQNVKCFSVLFYRCLNFTKAGPIPNNPAIRVGTVFIVVPKNGSFQPTKYVANIFDAL